MIFTLHPHLDEPRIKRMTPNFPCDNASLLQNATLTSCYTQSGLNIHSVPIGISDAAQLKQADV